MRFGASVNLGAAFDPKETVTNGGFRVGQFAAARKFLEPATT